MTCHFRIKHERQNARLLIAGHDLELYLEQLHGQVLDGASTSAHQDFCPALTDLCLQA